MRNLLNSIPIIIVYLLTFPQMAHGSTSADVVYIGDSHSAGCFGKTLDKSLRGLQNPTSHQPLVVRSAATCGSSTASWLNSSGNSTSCGYRSCDTHELCESSISGHSASLQSILADSGPRPKPGVTIVELGSNMLKSNLGTTMRDVESLIKKIKSTGSECIWIGPPQAATFFISPELYLRFVERLDEKVTSNGCSFVNSDKKTNRGNLNDPMGLHYDCAHATSWSEKVFSELSPIVINDLIRRGSGSAPVAQPATR